MATNNFKFADPLIRLLVHDLSGNGFIDNISETLSEYYNGAEGIGGAAGEKPFTDGFDALKSLDTNDDDVFDANDAMLGPCLCHAGQNAQDHHAG